MARNPFHGVEASAGPWHIATSGDDSLAIVTVDGQIVCPIKPRPVFPEDMPNFTLMAAAPELLEALKLLSQAATANKDIAFHEANVKARLVLAKLEAK